jgi:hypothetical protein
MRNTKQNFQKEHHWYVRMSERKTHRMDPDIVWSLNPMKDDSTKNNAPPEYIGSSE